MTRAKLGRYRIVRCIGRGGMGDVWLARYEAMPGMMRLAAIKLLRPGFVSGSSSPAKLFEEARLNAYISHANVVAVLEAGVDDGVAWLALEYVPGPTLRAICDAAWTGNNAAAVSPWIFASIAARACAGLAAVHDAKSETGKELSIIHRDVSPQNLLVSWDGAVKLLDFGIARSAIAAARTATGMIKGKLGYMAPEQVRGQPVDKRTDIFALGIVLWEALARRHLFATDNEAETYERVHACVVPPLGDDVPPSLAAVVHRALASEPSGRFWTALEMKQALDSAMMTAGVSIGEHEIAASIARLLPDRVREHEAWLAEASRKGESEMALAPTMLASVRDEAAPPETERLATKGTVPLAKPISISTATERERERQREREREREQTAREANARPPTASRPTPIAVAPPSPPFTNPNAVAPPPPPPPPTNPIAVAAPPGKARKSIVTILLAVVVAVAVVGAGVVAFFFVTKKRRLGFDPAFVSTVPSGVQPNDVRALAVDEPASPPGTPASSQKATPPWPARTISGDIAEYAPQLSDGLQAFMAAVPLGDAPVERTLIVCRIQSSGKADTLSGDDLQVRAVLGATPIVANDGPEDANLGFVSAPLATLKKGDAVHFEVYDRDVFSMKAIDNIQGTWTGGTLAARAPNATIECRQLGGAPLQKLVSTHSARADASTTKLARADLDGRTYDWAWPKTDLKTAQKDVGDIAALVGWDDARVHRRVIALDAALAAVNAKKPAIFDSLYAAATERESKSATPTTTPTATPTTAPTATPTTTPTATPTTTPTATATTTASAMGGPPGSATVARVTITAREPPNCAEHGAACTIRISMKNDGDKPLMRTGWAGVTAYAANRESGPEPVSFELRTMEGGSLDPGASLETTATPPRTLSLGNKRAILGVCREGQCAAIRLR